MQMRGAQGTPRRTLKRPREAKRCCGRLRTLQAGVCHSHNLEVIGQRAHCRHVSRPSPSAYGTEAYNTKSKPSFHDTLHFKKKTMPPSYS